MDAKSPGEDIDTLAKNFRSVFADRYCLNFEIMSENGLKNVEIKRNCNSTTKITKITKR
jgi:hypothetical protein